MKIKECLADVRKFIGQLTRQNLPASPAAQSFSSHLSEYTKTEKRQGQPDLKNTGRLTLQDYRNRALPVRVPRERTTSPKSVSRFRQNPSATISEVPAQIQKVMDDAAQKYQIPVELIRAVIKVESNFNPRAVSSEGARGLMQLMPATAKELGVRNSFDVKENVEAGSRYLKEMLDQFDGKLELALAAYNAGPGAVTRHKGIPPYRETQRYVRKVMAYC